VVHEELELVVGEDADLGTRLLVEQLNHGHLLLFPG
jgi:hypothetical protein